LLRSVDPGYVKLVAYSDYAEDESGLTTFSFIFPSSYLVPPIIDWTTPATGPYTLATTGLLTPDADITDADGNLVRIELISKNAAGVITKHLDCPLAPNLATTLQDCFTAAGVSGTIDLGTQTSGDQYFTLTLRSTDATGVLVESSRTLLLPGSSGAGLGGVTCDPDSGTCVGPVSIDLSVGGSATKIHYRIKSIGSSAPTGSGYTIVNATSVTISLNPSGRLWARASDGSNHGAWEYRDYQRS
jgi:hypothetical protein